MEQSQLIKISCVNKNIKNLNFYYYFLFQKLNRHALTCLRKAMFHFQADLTLYCEPKKYSKHPIWVKSIKFWCTFNKSGRKIIQRPVYSILTPGHFCTYLHFLDLFWDFEEPEACNMPANANVIVTRQNKNMLGSVLENILEFSSARNR